MKNYTKLPPKSGDCINETVGGVFVCLYNMNIHIVEGGNNHEIWICALFA